MAEVYSQENMYPFPRFSFAERDRRWTAVRRRMDREGIDVIVCPANSGHSADFQANSRYLSLCGGGGDADIAVVFPAEGEVTVIANAHRQWLLVQDWVRDVREAHRLYGQIIVDRLRELDADGKRIGITGLGGGTRTPEGTILHTVYDQIRKDFPNAQLIDATQLLSEVRELKSEEEISFLRISTELVDKGYAAAFNAARVGQYDYLVFAETVAAMLRGGSELPIHSNWVSGQNPSQTLARPACHRLLQEGDVILNEVESSWGGYRAQGVQPIAVRNAQSTHIELMKLQNAIYSRMLDILKPGVSVGELSEACKSICASERPRAGIASDADAVLTMHGRGQGEDGPIITPDAKNPHQLQRALQANMVFIFKPRVANREYFISWGDTIVIREDGPERLGMRDMGLWVTPG